MENFMIRIVRISVFLSLCLISACTTMVDLTVKNNTGTPLSASIVRWDESQIRTNVDLSLGRIETGESSNISFEIKHGGSFEVVGITNATIASSGKISVTKKPDPLRKSVNLNLQAKELDDTTSFEAISNSFKKLGDDLGAYPLPLQIALETTIGSLLIAEKGSNGKSGEVYLTIPPNIFGVKVLRLEDIKRYPTEEISQTETSGNSANKAAAEYGPIGGFNAGFQSDSVYHLKWILRGFGAYQKTEDKDKNPAELFSKLDKHWLNQIKLTLKKHPKAKIYYINQFYVLDRAELVIKEARLAKGEFNINTSIIKGGSVYTFENSQEQYKSYGPVVLNYWGNEFNFVEILNPKMNITTISGDPAITTETTPILIPTLEASESFSTYDVKNDNETEAIRY